MKDANLNLVGRLKRQVTAVIQSQSPERVGLAALLRMLAILYEIAVRLRAQYYRRRRSRDRRLACRVVSIGNLSAGGTGKTPLCIHLACVIHDAGHRVAIVSRGYRGDAERAGTLIEPAEAFAADADRAGDEPVLMARLLQARSIPVFTGRDRLTSGRKALAQFNLDVILLDDGFQHQQLVRDIDIVLLDAEAPLGNGYLLPRGPLREPPSALERADIVVLTRCPSTPGGKSPNDVRRQLHADLPGLAAKPLFTCRHRPVGRERVDVYAAGRRRSGPLDLAALKHLPVLAFSGIARNDTFRQVLLDLGVDLRGWIAFDDHYRYRAGDLESLVRAGRRASARALVTTDKDRVRIQDEWIDGLPLLVIGVSIDFIQEQGAFDRHVLAQLGMDAHREKRA